MANHKIQAGDDIRGFALDDGVVVATGSPQVVISDAQYQRLMTSGYFGIGTLVDLGTTTDHLTSGDAHLTNDEIVDLAGGTAAPAGQDATQVTSIVNKILGSFSAAVRNSLPYLWYRMDDTEPDPIGGRHSWVLADSSGNAKNGIINASTFDPSTAAAPGVNLTHDGVEPSGSLEITVKRYGGQIRTYSGQEMNFTKPWSLFFRYKQGYIEDSEQRSVVDANDWKLVEQSTALVMRAQQPDSSWVETNVDGLVMLWKSEYSIGLVYDGTNMSLFINGVRTQTAPATFLASTHSLSLGGPAGHFDSAIFWRMAVSDDLMSTLHALATQQPATP